MELLGSILFSLLWGYICYKMAETRHRDSTLGFILGAIFGLFAVAGYAIAGEKRL